jgi:hypothetical protein
LTAASLLVVATASAEVDFTPQESFYLAEATKVPCVAFHNAGMQMLYSAPAGWKLSGGGRKVTLVPSNKAQAEATMETRPSKAPLAATEENVKAYTELALRMLPREAGKVTVVDAAVCPMQMGRRPMVEVTLTYALYAQQFSMNLLFLPYEKELITFQVASRTGDYAPLAKVFRASLFSLQGL